MKNKNYLGHVIPTIWQLLKNFSGHFCQAQILILLGVCSNRQKEKGCGYKCFHKKTTLSMRMSLKNVQLNKLLQLF